MGVKGDISGPGVGEESYLSVLVDVESHRQLENFGGPGIPHGGRESTLPVTLLSVLLVSKAGRPWQESVSLSFWIHLCFQSQNGYTAILLVFVFLFCSLGLCVFVLDCEGCYGTDFFKPLLVPPSPVLCAIFLCTILHCRGICGCSCGMLWRW